jgi:hypothetical protein
VVLVPIIQSADVTSSHKIPTGASKVLRREIAVSRGRTVARDSDRARFFFHFLSDLIAWPGCTSAFPGYKAMGSDWRGGSCTGSCLVLVQSTVRFQIQEGLAELDRGKVRCFLSSPLLWPGLG